jgi:hypothetical protein
MKAPCLNLRQGAGSFERDLDSLEAIRPFGLTFYTFSADRHSRACSVATCIYRLHGCRGVGPMDEDLVEQIAQELAELDLLRVRLSLEERRRVIAAISDYHRKKARIAIRVMKRFRDRNNKI